MTPVTIVYDTWCGWCYGAEPLLTALIDSGAPVGLLHRALFTGANRHRMAEFGPVAWQHDQRIAAMSGQTFSETYRRQVLGDPDGVLDSWPTALAAAAVADRGPAVEQALARRLQHARYVDGHTTGNLAVIEAALRDAGLSAAAAHAAMTTDTTIRDLARQRQKEAAVLLRSTGADAVPALIVHADGGDRRIELGGYLGRPDALVRDLS